MNFYALLAGRVAESLVPLDSSGLLTSRVGFIDRDSSASVNHRLLRYFPASRNGIGAIWPRYSRQTTKLCSPSVG
jgi:hypothetical protein